MAKQSIVYHTLEPWFDQTSTVLILGTIPSVASCQNSCYYGHKQNRFWPVLAAVWGEEVPQTIEQRREFCRRHRIALWDVLASCEISGSEDASIRNPIINEIPWLLEQTNIRAIFTTGQKAKKLYDSLIYPKSRIEAFALPSTSPANRRWANDETLWRTYRILAQYGV